MSDRITAKELMDRWHMESTTLARHIFNNRIQPKPASQPPFLNREQWNAWKKVAAEFIKDGDITKSLNRRDFDFPKMMGRCDEMFPFAADESYQDEETHHRNILSDLLRGIERWLPYVYFVEPKPRFEYPNRVWIPVNANWECHIIRGAQQAKLVAILFEESAQQHKIRTAELQARLYGGQKDEIRIDKIITRLKLHNPAVGKLIKNDHDQDGYYIAALFD
jgi:hypothetical protein